MRIRRTKRKSAAPDWGGAFEGLSDIERLREYRSRCSWPNLYYSSTACMLNIAGVERFVEIGVAYGYHGVHLLSEVPGLAYTGVDPYASSYDKDDVFASDVATLFACAPDQAMDRLHAAVSAALADASGGAAQLLRMKSTDAVTLFDNESLDAVFIDGNHLTEAVQSDIAAWFPKLRPGGILLGDDYQRHSVKIAWDQAFAGSHSRDMHFIRNGVSGYRTVIVRKPS